MQWERGKVLTHLLNREWKEKVKKRWCDVPGRRSWNSVRKVIAFVQTPFLYKSRSWHSPFHERCHLTEVSEGPILEILKKGMGDFWQKVMIHVYLQIKTKQLHLLSSRDFSSQSVWMLPLMVGRHSVSCRRLCCRCMFESSFRWKCVVESSSSLKV